VRGFASRTPVSDDERNCVIFILSISCVISLILAVIGFLPNGSIFYFIYLFNGYHTHIQYDKIQRNKGAMYWRTT
jgi:hypothetical protein